ncbi:MAG: ParB/RepB/Spo0J family partition protein [Betaproteobacteria bacterium]|nr:ParB/RepB/Spo0J family partition protein [Betaproteobacteria bacterium]
MMMAKVKGLGRGLDALLAGDDAPAPASEGLLTLPVNQLQPGKYQPRTRMDEASLNELASSIAAQGLVQPIIVRPLGAGAATPYEIIAGERRWRASQIAGLKEVPVHVHHIADENALAMALIENIQREDLNPLEEAQGLRRLIDEFNLTHQQAAEAVGRSRSAATNLLRLLELAQPVQDLLMHGRIDMGHARALLALAGSDQVAVAQQVVLKALSVRETEELVRRRQQAKPAAKSGAGAAKAENSDVIRLSEKLADTLGAEVKIAANKQGSGKITISFQSLDQLDGLIERFFD